LLEERVINTGSAVEHDQDWLLAHGVPVRNEARAVNIDEQPHISDRDAHSP
jgi:hypothetical protein